MQIGTKEFSELCYSRHLRIEWIVPVGAAHDGTERSLCQPLEDWVEGSDLEDLEPVFPGFSAWCKRYQIDDLEEMLPEFLAERAIEGFVVAVCQCVRQYSTDRKVFDYSFGHTYGQLFHCETLDDAGLGKLLAWSDRMIDTDRAKAAAAAEGRR
jgi:hypothetical protein